MLNKECLHSRLSGWAPKNALAMADSFEHARLSLEVRDTKRRLKRGHDCWDLEA